MGLLRRLSHCRRRPERRMQQQAVDNDLPVGSVLVAENKIGNIRYTCCRVYRQLWFR